ncbi:hypothetical protein Tco_0354208, partial [Tanacetum coccineum]
MGRTSKSKGRASEERDMNRNQTTHSLAVKKALINQGVAAVMAEAE